MNFMEKQLFKKYVEIMDAADGFNKSKYNQLTTELTVGLSLKVYYLA